MEDLIEFTYSKVDACYSVEYNEDVGIRKFGETKVQSSWEQEYENLG